jgi:hypothetical protein
MLYTTNDVTVNLDVNTDGCDKESSKAKLTPMASNLSKLRIDKKSSRAKARS